MPMTADTRAKLKTITPIRSSKFPARTASDFSATNSHHRFPCWVIILDAHADDGRHAGEAENHHADQATARHNAAGHRIAEAMICHKCQQRKPDNRSFLGICLDCVSRSMMPLSHHSLCDQLRLLEV